MAAVDLEFQLDGQPEATGVLERGLEVEDGGLSGSEFGIHGPSGVRVIVQ